MKKSACVPVQNYFFQKEEKGHQTQITVRKYQAIKWFRLNRKAGDVFHKLLL